MAGKITVSTINDSSGVLATQNGMTGIAKAWVNFNGQTSAIRASFNVSSVTKNATGDWSISFTTAMPDANYAPQVSGQRFITNSVCIGAVKQNTTPSTTSVNIFFSEDTGSALEVASGYLAILGN